MEVYDDLLIFTASFCVCSQLLQEITPSTVSNASLFTPEEIYKRKKGSLVAQSEMERTHLASTPSRIRVSDVYRWRQTENSKRKEIKIRQGRSESVHLFYDFESNTIPSHLLFSEQKRHERKRAVMADETEEERGRREQREFNQQSMEKAKEELRKANDKVTFFNQQCRILLWLTYRTLYSLRILIQRTTVDRPVHHTLCPFSQPLAAHTLQHCSANSNKRRPKKLPVYWIAGDSWKRKRCV